MFFCFLFLWRTGDFNTFSSQAQTVENVVGSLCTDLPMLNPLIADLVVSLKGKAAKAISLVVKKLLREKERKKEEGKRNTFLRAGWEFSFEDFLEFDP